MKKFLGIVVLSFLLSLSAKADDIKEFTIEGMSIGDSALDFFEKSFILKNTWDYPGSNKYKRVQNDNMLSF